MEDRVARLVPLAVALPHAAGWVQAAGVGDTCGQDPQQLQILALGVGLRCIGVNLRLPLVSFFLMRTLTMIFRGTLGRIALTVVAHKKCH